jgi:hypothetical protein
MAAFALLSSSINEAWTRKNSSSLETRLRYVITDAFETLPLCGWSDAQLENVGRRYEGARSKLAAALGIGLTDLYNRFHSESDRDPGFVALRELHRELDLSVARAYGWSDLDLGHGFHSVPYLAESDRERFTISETARLEVLRRLGDLNRHRYRNEQASEPSAKPARKRTKAAVAGQGVLVLVDAPQTARRTSKAKAAPLAKKTNTRRTSR